MELNFISGDNAWLWHSLRRDEHVQTHSHTCTQAHT